MAQRRSRQVREVDLSRVIMSVSQRLDEHARVILPCHPAEPTEVIVTENGRNDDPRLQAGDEFGIHRDEGKSAVAVVKGVHLGDEEHHVDSALEGGIQLGTPLPASSQSADHQPRQHE